MINTSFKTFNVKNKDKLLNERFSNYSYKIPINDKEKLLYDFYIMVSLPTWKLNDQNKYPLQQDPELFFNIIENQTMLCNYLRNEQLANIKFMVASELRHLIENTAEEANPIPFIKWSLDHITDGGLRDDFIKSLNWQNENVIPSINNWGQSVGQPWMMVSYKFYGLVRNDVNKSLDFKEALFLKKVFDKIDSVKKDITDKALASSSSSSSLKNNIKKGDLGVDKPSSYSIANYAFDSIIKEYNMSYIEFIDLAYKCFIKFKWQENYGGPEWAEICKAGLRLYASKNLGDKMVAIDHIFDLEHNSGTIFNKIQKYYKYGSLVWLKTALDIKANVKSLYELFPYISEGLKPFVAHVIKKTNNTTYQKFLEDINFKIITSMLPKIGGYFPNNTPNYDNKMGHMGEIGDSESDKIKWVFDRPDDPGTIGYEIKQKNYNIINYLARQPERQLELIASVDEDQRVPLLYALNKPSEEIILYVLQVNGYQLEKIIPILLNKNIKFTNKILLKLFGMAPHRIIDAIQEYKIPVDSSLIDALYSASLYGAIIDLYTNNVIFVSDDLIIKILKSDYNLSKRLVTNLWYGGIGRFKSINIERGKKRQTILYMILKLYPQILFDNNGISEILDKNILRYYLKNNRMQLLCNWATIDNIVLIISEFFSIDNVGINYVNDYIQGNFNYPLDRFNNNKFDVLINSEKIFYKFSHYINKHIINEILIKEKSNLMKFNGSLFEIFIYIIKLIIMESFTKFYNEYGKKSTPYIGIIADWSFIHVRLINNYILDQIINDNPNFNKILMYAINKHAAPNLKNVMIKDSDKPIDLLLN